jgi:ligand-binding sensor domain-containing protein
MLTWLVPGPGAAGQATPALGVIQYQHTRRSVDDGFPAPIYSVVQSEDGYIWLATRDGVFRFDGIGVEEIPPDPKSISKLGAHKLVAARDGSVFVGYRQGSIAVYRDGAFHEIGPPGWISTSLAWMEQSADGAIWVANFAPDQPLARYRDGRWTFFGAEQGLAGEAARGLLAARDGTLWLTTQ